MSYDAVKSKPDFHEEILEKLGQSILLYFGDTKCENDWASKLHSHEYFEILLVTEGEGYLLVDKDKYHLKKNSIVFINSHTPHTEYSNPDNHMKYYFFAIDNLQFRGKRLNSIYTIDEGFVPVYSSTDENSSYDFLIRQLIDEADKKEIALSSIIKSYLSLILIHIIRFSPSSSIVEKSKLSCEEIKNYLDLNYAENFSLDDLAKKSYISRWHLIRTFKESTGYSPFQYITNKRIEDAKKQLKKTEKPIVKIAESLGYNSVSYFSQVFKKKIGMSPLQYRSSNGDLRNEIDKGN